MHRVALTVLAIATVFLAVGCDGPEATDILEPSFGKVKGLCPVLQDPAGGDSGLTKQDLLDYIYDGIVVLFDDKRSQNGAKGHVDNIVREICRGDYDAALSFVHSFVQQVNGQPEDKLNAQAGLAADLVNWVIIVATDPADIPFAIPAGAFELTGILAIVDPAFGGPLSTRDGLAVVDTDDFSSTTPFIMALSP